jgi:hypothetical protein
MEKPRSSWGFSISVSGHLLGAQAHLVPPAFRYACFSTHRSGCSGAVRRGFAYVFAPDDELDSLAALRLRWLHWLVTGSGMLCLVLITGKLGLHYPLCTMAWLLGSGVLSRGRQRLHQLLPEERSWTKVQVGVLGMLSPLLVGAVLMSSDDIAFEDAHTKVEVDRSFALEESEEYGQIRFYQTRFFLFHEQVGHLDDRQLGAPSAGTIYSRNWWKRVQAVAFGPTDREA